MESYVDIISCPVCGSDAHNEIFLESGEDYILCGGCGYNRRFYITNLADQKKDADSEFGWVPQYTIDEFHGCGAYKLRGKGMTGYEHGSFTQPESEQELINLVEARKDELEHAEYTMYKDGQLNRVVLIQGEVELYSIEHNTNG